MVWLYHSPIPAGRRGVIYGLGGRGEGFGTLWLGMVPAVPFGMEADEFCSNLASERPTECQAFSLVVGIGSPLGFFLGGTHLLAAEGAGGANSYEGKGTLVL
jgi:hypothetical protein